MINQVLTNGLHPQHVTHSSMSPSFVVTFPWFVHVNVTPLLDISNAFVGVQVSCGPKPFLI
jgi:hypothetical protein